MGGHTQRDVFNAIVSDNADPEKRGRIKVRCGEIAGSELDLPEWIEPCFQYAGSDGAAGFFFVPAVGDLVEIERAVGHTDDDASGMAMIIDPETHWRCVSYATAADVPTEFSSGAYGKRMGIKTPGGNLLIFDEQQSAIFLVATTLIKLGSEQAAQPLVLGTVFNTFAGALIDAILAHNHTHPQGATTGLVDATAFNTLKSSYVTNSAMLSQKVTTE